MPDDLPDSPFLGSASSLSRQSLRARRFRRETRDVYVLADHAPSLRLRVGALQTALPDAVASHTTAALLARLPVPRDARVHLTRPRGSGVSERPGVLTHRGHVRPSEVVTDDGVRLTGPARTWIDLAARLPLVELVVLGDAVARLAGLGVLSGAVDRAAGLRGVVRARQALTRIDPGADSPAETRARLVLHDAGFTALRHQVELRDEHGGWLSRPDLADTAAGVAVQYDGLVHLEGGPEQWRADIDRDERTRAAGWEVVVLTAVDLRRPSLLVAKVAAAYVRAGQRR